MAPAFSFALLQALLDCLPSVATAQSAGALHWYFTLLNRVKCMDVGATGQRCADILLQVARQYSQRTNSQHALLKARCVSEACVFVLEWLFEWHSCEIVCEVFQLVNYERT